MDGNALGDVITRSLLAMGIAIGIGICGIVYLAWFLVHHVRLGWV